MISGTPPTRGLRSLDVSDHAAGFPSRVHAWFLAKAGRMDGLPQPLFPTRRTVAAVLLVFLLALVPRLIGVGKFLTADEKNWVGRGVEFVRALQEFRFNDTLQTTHPGIPTVWIAGLTARAISSSTGTPFTFDALRTFVLPTQSVFAVLTSALIAATFLALRGLFPERFALLAAAVLAFDPFLVAYGRLVHVDAALTGFLVLAVLFLLRARLKTSGLPGKMFSNPLLWSAIVGALAILSKVPALLLIPFAAVVLWMFPHPPSGAERITRGKTIAQWLVVLGAVMLLLWPGLLWVPDPLGNIKTVKRDVTIAVTTPHLSGDEESERPFHYARTLIARSTIPTLLGGVAALALLLAGTRTRQPLSAAWSVVLPSPGKRSLALLAAFGALFVLGMSLGAKKGDRYILPVFPILDILAVAGVCLVVQWLRPRWSEARTLRLASIIILLPLLGELLRLGPYTLAHYNPLVPPNFSQELGWGEGLDQVAGFLNAQPDSVAVASWYPEELRPYVDRPVSHLSSHTQIPVGYVVLYRNMFGRPKGNPAEDFLDEYYQKLEPVFVARVNGLPYAWVYRKPVFSGTVGELILGTSVIAELPLGPGSLTGVEIFVATYSQRAHAGNFHAQLLDESGTIARIARAPVRPEDDNRWVRLPVDPVTISTQKTFTVILTAEGTSPGNAPTIRRAPKEKPAPRYWVGRVGEPPARVMRQPPARGLLGLRALITPE